MQSPLLKGWQLTKPGHLELAVQVAGGSLGWIVSSTFSSTVLRFVLSAVLILPFLDTLDVFSSHHTICLLSAIPLAVWVVWECLFSVPTDSIYLRNLQTGVHELISGNSWSLWVVCPFNLRKSFEGWSVTSFKAVCALASFLPRWNVLSQRKLLQNVGGDCTLDSWLPRAK